MMEVVRAPRLFPSGMPRGPYPQECDYATVAQAVDDASTADEVDGALGAWYSAAEEHIGQAYAIDAGDDKYHGRGRPVTTAQAPRWSSSRSVFGSTMD